MRILPVDITNTVKNSLTFGEVDECGLSWTEQKIALEHRLAKIRNRVAEKNWWENASEWDKFVRMIKDYFKNIFKK